MPRSTSFTADSTRRHILVAEKCAGAGDLESFDQMDGHDCPESSQDAEPAGRPQGDEAWGGYAATRGWSCPRTLPDFSEGELFQSFKNLKLVFSLTLDCVGSEVARFFGAAS